MASATQCLETPVAPSKMSRVHQPAPVDGYAIVQGWICPEYMYDNAAY